MQDLFDIVLKIVIELLIKGPGYFIIRMFRRDLSANEAFVDDGLDSCLVFIVGAAFWAAVFGVIWLCSR